MNVYTYTEARQNLARLLEQVLAEGEARIRRKDGQVFVIKPAQKQSSSFDVAGLDLDISAAEIVQFVQESRQHYQVGPGADWEEEVETLILAAAQPLNEQEIYQGLAQAQKLLEAGFTEISLLQAWSAAEAGCRLMAQQGGLEIRPMSSGKLVKFLVDSGTISQTDYELLTNVMKLRNALAHGYSVADYDPAIITELINTVTHFLPAQPAR